MRNFKENLNLIIRAFNENQREAADFIGISDSQVSKMMGSDKPPSRPVVALLEAKAAQCERGSSTRETQNLRKGPADSKTRRVPVISWVRAGLSENFAQDYSDNEHQIDEWFDTDCQDPMACALIVEGDSMEPEYFAGDRIVASPREVPRPNDLVVARLLTGEMFFKKFKPTGKNSEEVILFSVNPSHDPLQFHRDKFQYIFPVVDMRRKPRR